MPSARGKLKIFFGMAAGVGKTYAMLEADPTGWPKKAVDVVIGYVEPHARPETSAGSGTGYPAATARSTTAGERSTSLTWKRPWP